MKRLLAMCLLISAPAFAADAPAPETTWQERALYVAGLTKANDPKLGAYANNPTYAAYAASMEKSWAHETTESLAKITAWRKTELPASVDGQDVFYPLGGADLPNAMTFFPNAPRYTFIALEPVGEVPELTPALKANWLSGLEGVRQTFGAMCGLNYFESRMLRVSWSNHTVNGNLPLFLAFIVRMGGEVLSVSNFDLDPAGKKVYTTALGKPGVEIRFKRGDAVKTLDYHQIYLGDNLLTNSTPQGNWLKSRPRGVTLLKAAVYLYFWDSEKLFKELTLDKSSLVLQDDSGIPYESFNNASWSSQFYGMYSKPGPVGGIEKVPYQKDLEAAYAKGAKPFTFNYGYGILWGGQHRANLMVFTRK